LSFLGNYLLVWAMVPSSAAGENDAKVYWWSGPADSKESGVLSGFDFDSYSNGSSCLALVETISKSEPDTFYLYIPQPEDDIHIWTGPPGGPMQRIDRLPSNALPLPQPPRAGLVVTNVEYATALQPGTIPTALVWTQKSIEGGTGGDPQLWALTFGLRDWVWTNLGIPPNLPHDFEIPLTTALTPWTGSTRGYLLEVFVAWDSKLYVSRQIQQTAAENAVAPLFTPMIPLQPGVRTMTSQAGVSSGNELVVVDTGGALQTLQKDSVTGVWTEGAVQLPASELQQNSSYRVTVTLADAGWNAPVTSHDLTITASTPAVAVIEGTVPRTVVIGTTPVTVTTDTQGQASLALLADGLSAPTLTITSAGLAKPATVYPSEAINTYMQGDGTLNFLPTMSAGTLADAKTPDGQTVAPGARDDAATADQVATMKQAADLGAQGRMSSALSTTVGGPDGALQAQAGSLSARALASSIDHWAQDVFHAVKKGAVAVEKVAVDAETKIFTIALDLANWASNTVQVVVHTIEDAARVLHAVFNQLKADIAVAVKWMRALVGSLLQDSAKVARVLATLLGQATTFIGTEADTLKASIDTLLVKQETQVEDLFARIRGRYPQQATLGSIGDFNPAGPGRTPAATAAPAAPATAAADDDDGTPPPHGDWFLTKVKHSIFGALDTPEFAGRPFSALAAGLRQAGVEELEAFAAACEDFWKFIKEAVTHPSQFETVGVSLLLDAVSKLIHAALAFIRSILDALFDMIKALSPTIAGMLATPLKDAGIVGKLLALAGLGDIEIGAVVTMVFAFPATLVYKLANGPGTRPFSYVPGLQASPGAEPSADRALQITAAAALGVWAGLDTVSTLASSIGVGVPLLTPAIDTAGPLIIGALAPPFTKDGLPDWRTASGDDADSFLVLSWLLDILPAFFSAMVIYSHHYTPDDAKGDENVALWRQTMCGAVSLVSGVLAAHYDPDADGKDYALPILLNLPNLLAFCNTESVIEESEGVSAVLSLGFGLFGGVAGAAIYGTN
jgi:hypothetical protein